MWHIHGLASVMRRPIMSIYPEVQDHGVSDQVYTEKCFHAWMKPDVNPIV